jgi:8-oxo-dGTP pyrophosphatase MutT (NUDIX family)
LALIRHRETARIALQADSGRFLLMFSHWSPESGLEPRWVSPGGGIEPHEDPAIAASRELLEETGLVVDPKEFGPKVAQIEFRQEWQTGDYETGIAHFFKLQIRDEFEVQRSFWTPEEHRDILDVRWWNPETLKASGETVGPPGLVDLLVELG